MIPSAGFFSVVSVTVYQRGLVIDSQQAGLDGTQLDSISKGIGD